MRWVTSSYSSESANCVQVAVDEHPDEIVVRNSRDPNGPRLRFTPAEWSAFLAGAMAGEFGVERLTPH